MADIELVIKIPKETYEKAKIGAFNCTVINKAILDGVALPKGHGRILDEKEILDTNKNDGILYDLVDMPEYIGKVPAIIEAESEEVDGNND